jgi:hypothetical protein
VAKAVAEAVSPDNFKTPRGLTVSTTHRQRKVTTKIECKEKLSTFIATMDDLLSSVSITEKTVQAIERGSRNASKST